MSSSQSEIVSEYQTTLLLAAERFFGRGRIPKRIRQAFMDTPRHLFAKRFYSSAKQDWVDLETADLRDHLTELYSDHPLCIYRDKNGKSLSTVSQPSLVLYMIDLLELEPGQSVFELGGGSGWNAALMAHLVGKKGKILSLEIIEELTPSAQAALEELNLNQVCFRSGDANLGSDEGNFDRGVFTASAWDLPACFYQQIKPKGLLLYVFKAQPNYDLLCLLRKTDQSHFESELHFSCSFVPVTGSNSQPNLPAIPVSKLPPQGEMAELAWNDIKIADTAIPEFIDFTKLVFDCQQSYLVENDELAFDEEFWAVGNPKDGNLLLYNEDRLLLYGDDTNLIKFRRTAKRWQKAKQPGIEDLKLSVYAASNAPETSNDQWAVNRGDSTFIWGI
ncbi:protein-L-isoaspartate O-methyltransferase family protein [Pelagicoccus mobilis]|uniref:Protein-L-isoaspartate O-methyltransferase n=1 Tax=Pelagicoccus mobilis TaxID=415221 RepID=A0A934VR26_9BACT|nr:hypothetical protein [Pelagicoccus mobilis]MBK1877505.1 hypothetical protein [Pelagicoccus mobilis]